MSEHEDVKQSSPQPEQKTLRDVNDDKRGFLLKERLRLMWVCCSRDSLMTKSVKKSKSSMHDLSQISLVRSASGLSGHHGSCELLGL